MTTNPPSLPSTVEESLAECPRFRILVVGNTGIGKSSLVSSIFDVKDIDIAHDRVGKANIAHEYTSSTNPRFILHDSKGFESGSKETWTIVEDFIRNRCSAKSLKDRLHTIWLCLETPREGSRLLETGDQKLLKIANELKLPVIIVFTKYDLLLKAKKGEAKKSGVSEDELQTTAEKNAAADLRKRLDGFRDNNINLKFVEWVKNSRSNYEPIRSTDVKASTTNVESKVQSVPWVEVSTHQKYRTLDVRVQMLKKLTEVTRKCLHNVEGDLHLSWAIAQKIHAQQKVNSSIDEGFKKYWMNLGVGTIFEGEILGNCVSRIHDDILLVWNFYDPYEILSGGQFRTDMIKLIQPLLLQQPESQSDVLSNTSDLASLAGNILGALSQVVSAAGIAAFVIKFLCGKYQKIPSTVLCLGAYIVDLTLILHNLFMDMLPQEPPRPVSREFVQDTLHNYKASDASRVHELVHDIAYGRRALRPEEKIADLIRKELKMDPMQDYTAYGAHNGQLEAHNQRREASTPGAVTGTNQDLDRSDENMGGDHGSRIEQDRNMGDNGKVGYSIPTQDTDAGDRWSKHEDSKKLKMDPMQNHTAYGGHNEQRGVRNQTQETATRGAESGSDQILNGKSDVNIGGDNDSGVHKHQQDGSAGDNHGKHKRTPSCCICF